MIGLVRLLLRGLLLMLLLLAIAGGWVATGFAERMFFVGAGAALVAGIYFVGRLKRLDTLLLDAPREAPLPASRVQTEKLALFWSAQTPFYVDDPGVRRRAGEEPPWYAPFYPMLSPGFHLLALRLLPPPVALGMSAFFWKTLFVFWEPIYAAARDRLGFSADQLFEAWTFLTILLFTLLLPAVHSFLRYSVPARCTAPGCGSPAYLSSRYAKSLGYSHSDHMWFYTCCKHRHVQSTGVAAFGA